MPSPSSYDPTLFNVGSEREARRIILMPEAGMSTDFRWEHETADIMGRLDNEIGNLSLATGASWAGDPQEAPTPRWLDLGCGIGRIARPLCQRGHKVVGFDISPDMRRLAAGYVDSPLFRAHDASDLLSVAFEDGRFDAGYAFWVLQHIPEIRLACRHLHIALAQGAPFFLLNRDERCIPVVGGWADDGANVEDELRAAGFTLIHRQELGAPLYEKGSVWSEWRRA